MSESVLDVNKIIVTRQNSGAASAAAPSSLDYGELAVDINGVLRTGNKNKQVVTHVVSTDSRLTDTRNPRVTALTNQNLNDITTPGFYYAGGGNTVTNKPSGVDAFGLLVERTAEGFFSQTLTSANQMNGKIFFRQISSGTTWTAWSNFYTTAYKPTLSELGAAAAVHTHIKSQITDFPTSLKNPTSIKIQLNGGTSEGTNQFTYDGSVAKNINITPAVIGAATSQHTQAASTITGLAADRALMSDASGHPAASTVTSTELGYLDGVTSNIQTQLNGKSPNGHTHPYLPLSGGTMTGAITLPGNPTSNLHAATKQYVDSKIAASGSGDMLKSVYDTDEDGVVDKAEKLGTARTITLGTAATATATSFDGSQNITIPVTEIKESYLSWGGKNVAGAITPIDAALADFSSGNRLFGTPASSISVEVSRDGGSTWSAYPKITDDKKRRLVSTETCFNLGGVNSENTTQDQLRVTIAAESFYFACRKVLMYISSDGATGMQVNIKYSAIGAPDTFKDYGTFSLSGWPNWNSIPLSTTWGGSPTQISHTKKVQFTFTMTGAGPAGLCAIYAYGETAWISPNVMAKYGRSYDVDYDCNSTFRGKVILKEDPSSNLEAATKQYVDKGAISTYTHSKTGTVHTLTGSGDNIRFVATADFTSGDTFKIGGSVVTAKTIGGDSLWTGFFKKDSVVTCYKNGTTITFNGGGLPAAEAAKLAPENIKTGVSITANGKTVNGTFTADGTAAAGDMLAGKVAYVNGQKVTGTIPGNPAEVNLDPPRATDYGLIYDFNDVNTYYTSGYYWSPNEDIAPAIGLTSDKLKAGEKVLGVTGSFTADANATAYDLRSGKTAYVNGQKVTGFLASRDTGTPNPIEFVRLANGRFEVAPPAGIHGCYWDGGQYSYLSYEQVRNTIGLTADKIVAGNEILGVWGNGRTLPSIQATEVSYWGNFYETIEVDAPTGGCYATGICAGTDYYTTVRITLSGWNGSSWDQIESNQDYSGTSKKDPQTGMARWNSGYSKYQMKIANDRNARGLNLGILVGY